jgi:hypothetical protein
VAAAVPPWLGLLCAEPAWASTEAAGAAGAVAVTAPSSSVDAFAPLVRVRGLRARTGVAGSSWSPGDRVRLRPRPPTSPSLSTYSADSPTRVRLDIGNRPVEEVEMLKSAYR